MLSKIDYQKKQAALRAAVIARFGAYNTQLLRLYQASQQDKGK